MTPATGTGDGAHSIRLGTADDMIGCTRVWRATIDPALPAISQGYPLYQHELDTGTLLVAEDDGAIVGFAGSTTRGERWFLADLFVDPERHGLGLGRRLLEALVAADAPGPVRATMASDDPRALTLYTKLGMSPRWPCFSLIGTHEQTKRPDVTTRRRAERCSPSELVTLADSCRYELAADDLAYWQGTVEVDTIVIGDAGGAVVRWSTPFSIDHPEAISIGPLFARSAELLPAVVAAVLDAVRSDSPHTPTKMYVPGPSPALGLLLDAGHRIEAFDLFSASTDSVLDPHRTLPSHDLL